MNTIQIARAFCDEHLDQCYFVHNERTGITTHLDDFQTRRTELEATGYVYAGHRHGVMTFNQRNTVLTSLPLGWQIAQQAHEAELFALELENQDW